MKSGDTKTRLYHLINHINHHMVVDFELVNTLVHEIDDKNEEEQVYREWKMAKINQHMHSLRQALKDLQQRNKP